VETRYNTFWPRFGANLIDGLVLWPVGRVLAFAYESASFAALAYLIFVLHSSVYFVYSVYLHGRFGQTIGKWVMKVQVISTDERRLSMRQAFLRDSVPIVLTVLLLLFAIQPMLSAGPSGPNWGDSKIPHYLVMANLTWFLLELGTMLTNEKRRAIHDFIAGSVVVRRSNPPLQPTASGGG
jgi:uncharacterized RDD family membrane protein YckC